MSTSKALSIIGILFALYLVLKWTCHLLFGLFDYIIIIGIIILIVWYLQLPLARKQELSIRAKENLKALSQKLGID